MQDHLTPAAFGNNTFCEVVFPKRKEEDAS
jgi:hypothetical protein